MAKHSSLIEALLEVQKDLPKIVKGNKVNAGSMKYAYADLTDVTEALMPVLTAHGLVFMAMPTVTELGHVLHYRLAHESGQSVDGFYPLPVNVRSQELGSAITYARRYALCAVTGVAPVGDDDDGAKAQKPNAVTVAPGAVVAPMPDGFRELVTGATDLDTLRELWKQAANGGFLDEAKQMMENRKAVLSRG
jgi:hypothetical protein